MISNTTGPTVNPLAADLDHILTHTVNMWEGLRGKRIFITGGTGFFGTWLLESFAWANDELQLCAEAVVLTRNSDDFMKKAPHLAQHPSIHFHPGDVRSFGAPEGHFTHIIHAAAELGSDTLHRDPSTILETIVQGTRRVLDFAVHCGADTFLLTSSGAVYGKQPPDVSHIAEDYRGPPDIATPLSTYGEAKRMAELLSILYAGQYGIETKIARCFAFVGPYLPLDAHFAIGNFILDGIHGRPIQVKGDGTPYRSYLYAADLAVCLWTILFRGMTRRPYNVGSEAALTIAELAESVGKTFDPIRRCIIGGSPIPGKPPERYVPSVERLTEELGCRQHIDLFEALRRTIKWSSRIINGRQG